MYISEIVLEEIARGDKEAADRRIAITENLGEVGINNTALELANRLVEEIPLPKKAQLDALHIATATINGIDYLLTWNCRHIANAIFRHKIEKICRSYGFEAPVICTPTELMETSYE